MTIRERKYFEERKRAKATIAAGGWHRHLKKFKITSCISFADQRKWKRTANYKNVLAFNPPKFEMKFPTDPPDVDTVVNWMNNNWSELGDFVVGTEPDTIGFIEK